MTSDVEAVLPLILAQRGILAGTFEDGALYVGQQVIEVAGPLDFERLRSAWNHTVNAHQATRARFLRRAGSVLQMIQRHVESPLATFDLTGFELSNREQAARAVCEDEQRAGIDIGNGPLVRLAVLNLGSERHRLCLTHHHAGVDGRGISVLLDDLARSYNDTESASPLSPTLVDVTRAIVHEEFLAHRTPIDFSGDLNMCRAGDGAALPRTVERSFRREALDRAATAAGVTPASICISSWLAAMASQFGERQPVCCLSHDRRPAGMNGADRVVGMFTETKLVATLRFDSTSPAAAAHHVIDLLVEGGGAPSLPRGLIQARRAGSTGRPDVLLTIYSGDTLPEPPEGLRWKLVGATERTEFALDITIHVSATPTLSVTYDAHRIGAEEVAELVDRTVSYLEDPTAVVARIRTRRHRLPARTADAAVDALVAVASQLAGRDVSASEDLVAEGWDSLALLELADALLDQGIGVRVRELVQFGSLEGVASYLASTRRPAVQRPGAEPDVPSTTPIEAGLLELSLDRNLGEAPLHEQSVLMFDKPLAPDRIREAFARCLQLFPSLDRWWDGDGIQDLAPRGNRAAAFTWEDTPDEGDAFARGREFADADLRRRFQPGCGPLVRLHLVRGGDSTSALVLSFHYAMLDGWSFGTFVRCLQAAYVRSPRLERLGSDTAAYRQRSASEQMMSSPWTDLMVGLNPISRPTPLEAPRSGRAGGALASHLVEQRARQFATTPATLMQAATIVALRHVLEHPADRAIAVRTSARDGSEGATTRTVGQLTTDIPVPASDTTLGDVIEAIGKSRRRASETTRVGHNDFADATGCSPGEIVTDTAIVVENYFRFDETLIRRADSSAWVELAAWRRDVSPAWRTVNLDEHDGTWSVDIQTIIDDEPQMLAEQLLAQIAMTLIGEPA